MLEIRKLVGFLARKTIESASLRTPINRFVVERILTWCWQGSSWEFLQSSPNLLPPLSFACTVSDWSGKPKKKGENHYTEANLYTDFCGWYHFFGSVQAKLTAQQLASSHFRTETLVMAVRGADVLILLLKQCFPTDFARGTQKPHLYFAGGSRPSSVRAEGAGGGSQKGCRHFWSWNWRSEDQSSVTWGALYYAIIWSEISSFLLENFQKHFNCIFLYLGFTWKVNIFILRLTYHHGVAA